MTLTKTCATCHFGAQNGTQLRFCRRYPPQVMLSHGERFPYVENDWWCGEWSATGAKATNVDILDNFRARCPGCGNLKGRRHNQGCPHIVRAPHRRLKP